MGLSFSVISHVQRPVHRTWHMEIVNKILQLWVKVMSHHGEASMKHDRKVCDFCPILTIPSLIYYVCQVNISFVLTNIILAAVINHPMQCVNLNDVIHLFINCSSYSFNVSFN